MEIISELVKLLAIVFQVLAQFKRVPFKDLHQLTAIIGYLVQFALFRGCELFKFYGELKRLLLKAF
jgi:hypothetical protein